VTFPDCTELRKVHPNGVAREGVICEMVSGTLRPFRNTPVFDTPLYEANVRRDGDKDGIAYEEVEP
jgi:hypothetical protein